MNNIDQTALSEQIRIADLPEGREVVTYALCTEKEAATDRNGKAYMRLKLRDASGEVKAIHFDPSEEAAGRQRRRRRQDRRHVQRARAVRAAVPGPAHAPHGRRRVRPGPAHRRLAGDPPKSCTSGWPALIDGVVAPHLRMLLELATDGSREPGAAFLIAPAAVRNHHAYRHGLLEHSLIVAEVAAGVAANFVTVNDDLVIAGALLHDIGKTQAYSTDMLAPGFTDVGRLHGEIVIGHDMVNAISSARCPTSRPSSPRSCGTSSSATTARRRRAARSSR